VDEGSLERRIVTILFADLVGFTSLSERLDPEDVSTIQTAYFSSVRDAVARYGGQLEKFIGDAAMAVFGIPRSRDDDAERAARAGLALVGAVEQLGARLGLDTSEVRLGLRVGINTGEVVLAEDQAGQWRVTGDAVNVAARFQAAAPPGGVLVGETTALAVAESVETESVGAIELKGKAEPVRAWAVVGVRPSPSREHAMGELRAPTLGRDDELAALDGAAERVVGGRAERWVVVAPPGVGKSRLMEEFARTVAPRHGMEVWRARLRPDVLAPYEPVAQLFASALAGHGWAPTDSDAKGALEQILGSALEAAGASRARARVVMAEAGPLLGQAPDPGEGTGSIAAGEREQRFHAWLEALDALALDRSVAWVVEDVHWAGGDVLAFLAFAGAERSRSGRLVLATARPSLLEERAAWCEPSEVTHVFHLQPLSAPASQSLVTALVGDAIPEELVSTIAERSDGNALFIEELLRTWVSVGTLVRSQDGAWKLSASAGEVPLPSTVQAIYAAQLDDLAPGARLAARRASVAGRRFPRDALEPLGVADPDPAIEVLSRRALVAGPFADPLLGRSHQFRHALLRDAGYASLPKAERALLHVRLARWLEQAAGERWAAVAEVIGNHYRAALSATPALAVDVGDGVTRREAARLAASWFERAATAAVGVAAHDAARALLHQALDLTPDADVLDAARRWQGLGDATAYVADMDEGAEAFRAAADLFARVLSDPQASLEDRDTARSGYGAAVTAVGLVLIQQLQFQEATAMADRALKLIGPAGDLPTARLRYLRAWGAIAWAPRPEARPDLEAALETARIHGDRRLELDARYMLLSLQMEQGTIALADSDAEDLAIARLAEESRQWDRACRAWRMRAMIRSEEGDETWTELFGHATGIAEAHGLTEESAWNDYGRVEIGLLLGDWDEATDAGVQALDLADRNAYHRVQARVWIALTPIASAVGRWELLERAGTWFEEHKAIFPPSPFGRFMVAALDCRLADAGLRPPPALPEDLLELFAETPGWASGLSAVETVVEAWLAAGDLELAGRAVQRSIAWASHPTMTKFFAAGASLLAARLHVATGEPSQGSAAARIALEGFRRLKTPWWAAKSIRLLESIDEATSEDVTESARIERTLRLLGPAR
jgi:class 3 adenylate cyclase/tetratricopeptide (TPR) repeat protein